MASSNRSIFRERAIEKYVQKQELNVVLRLVSPPIYKFLWALLLLSVCAGALVWSIQEPVIAQGKGIVVQQKATTAKNGQNIVVLLLLPTDQQGNVKVGQPVTVSIATSNITFHTTITSVEAGVMSPAAISTQINLQISQAQILSGPAIVALAPVEPMSLAMAYLGSQCQVQVQVGTESALSMLPGTDTLPQRISSIITTAKGYFQYFTHLLTKL